MSSDESPAAWWAIEGFDKTLVRSHRVGSVEHGEGSGEHGVGSCSKQKCLALRHFIRAARHAALGIDEEAKEHLLASEEALTSWSPEDEDAEVKKKVLRVLSIRLAEELHVELHAKEEDIGPLASNAERAMFHCIKGKFYLFVGHLPQALAAFDQSLNESPDSGFGLSGRVQALRGMRFVREFKTCLGPREVEALEIKFQKAKTPKRAMFLAMVKNDEMRAVEAAGGWLESAEYFRRWSEILELVDFVVAEGGKTSHLVRCGNLYVASPGRLNRRRDAKAAYLKALEINEHYFYAHQKLGRYLIRQREFKEGLEHLRRSLDPASNFFRGYFEYLAVRYYLEEDADLDSGFQEVMTVGTDFHKAQTLVALAQVKARRGDRQAALILLDEAEVKERSLNGALTLEFPVFPPSRYSFLKSEKVGHVDEAELRLSGTAAVEPPGYKTDPGQLLRRRGGGECGAGRSEPWLGPGGRGGGAFWRSRESRLWTYNNRGGDQVRFRDAGGDSGQPRGRGHWEPDWNREMFTIAELREDFQKQLIKER